MTVALICTIYIHRFLPLQRPEEIITVWPGTVLLGNDVRARFYRQIGQDYAPLYIWECLSHSFNTKTLSLIQTGENNYSIWVF